MISSRKLAALLAGLLLTLVVACNGRAAAPTPTTPVVQGPALVMFYTDN
jgi:hypothetical protein